MAGKRLRLIFTARGEKANCSGLSEDGVVQNEAVFKYDFHGVNYLTISGNDYRAPKMKKNSIGGAMEKVFQSVSGTLTFNKVSIGEYDIPLVLQKEEYRENVLSAVQNSDSLVNIRVLYRTL